LNLFNRTINISVKTVDEQHVQADGIFMDSNHELVLSMIVDIDKFVITSAQGELRRAPHEDCRETAPCTQNLAGVDLSRNVRRQVVAAVGGGNGCVHFEELALECIKGVKQAKFRLMRLSRPAEEVHETIYDILEGTCHHFKKRE
jgi:hypothetical protein